MNEKSNRREFIKKASLAAIGTAVVSQVGASTILSNKLHGGPQFSLAPLPYDFKALEPHIDAMTMEIHYTKHHKAYVDNLNKICDEKHIHESNIENLLKSVSSFPVGIRNNGGGHYNHTMFWNIMKPNGGGLPKGAILDAINASFGSFEGFKVKFADASKARFGSGWTWLVAKDGKLDIGSTPNQDNPLMDVSELKGNPVLCLDVWEHAYYLKYQNKRADYIEAWFNLINWDEANKHLMMK
jgi:Fe-Mn family superoxide dismutase